MTRYTVHRIVITPLSGIISDRLAGGAANPCVARRPLFRPVGGLFRFGFMLKSSPHRAWGHALPIPVTGIHIATQEPPARYKASAGTCGVPPGLGFGLCWWVPCPMHRPEYRHCVCAVRLVLGALMLLCAGFTYQETSTAHGRQ
ncbi:MAG: hypothetical protein ACLR7Z_14140 [Bilophila wadsworthia]